MNKNNIFEGLPPQIKKFLELIPQRKKIGRNERCPCGSGKKFKFCCFGKKWSEIDLKFYNLVLRYIIKDIETKYPKNSFIIFEKDDSTLYISSKYGEYLSKEWALYFYRKYIEMSDKNFNEISNKVIEYINSTNEIIFRSNNIINENENTIKEIEILFLAFKKEFIIKVLKSDVIFIIDLDDIQYKIIQYIGKLIHQFLKKEGYSSTYPREITSSEIQSEDFEQKIRKEMNSQFIIELRSAQKLLYTSNIANEVLKKCESPIEKRIALGMVENNIPFIQQYEIFNNYKKQNEDEICLTKTDFFIPDPYEPVAIYCDGFDFHGKTPEQLTHDRRIDRKLQELGIIVLRFVGTEIENNLERCIEDIKKAYLGNVFGKEPREIILKKLSRINPKAFAKNDWEINFYKNIIEWVKSGKPTTIKQEKVINKLLKKTVQYYKKKDKNN